MQIEEKMRMMKDGTQVALRRQQAQEESEARELQFMYNGSGTGESGIAVASSQGVGQPGNTNNEPRASFNVFGANNPKDGELSMSEFHHIRQFYSELNFL